MKQELPQCHPIAKYSPFLKFASLLIEATEKAYLTSLSPLFPFSPTKGYVSIFTQ